ncbi:MAG: hypothetical protein RBS17_01575 [Coriobacteriia bacterium]|nr:hypothetical protein [Coriobacteriia bacterium]
MIGERIKAAATRTWEPYQPTSFWASRLGHPCARYLYHAWVDYDKAAPHPEGLREVFAEGRAQERAVELMLADCGFRVIKTQQRVAIEDPPITGKIDGRIAPESHLDGWPLNERGEPKAILYEIKSVSQYTFPNVNSMADMISSDRWYERLWPAQLQLYMYALGEDVGIMLLKNKARFAVKDLWIEKDPLYIASLLDRAREVYESILDLDPPERTEGEQCHECEYQLVCKPDLYYGEGAAISDDDRLAALLNRREELQPARKELESVEAELKKLLGERETVVCGDWLVRGTWVERKEAVIPAGRYLRRTYTRMGGVVE